MKFECFIDISLNIPKDIQSLKIEQTINEFQLSLNLGSLKNIQIQDKDVLCLNYSYGVVRLDVDEQIFSKFLLTEIQNNLGNKYAVHNGRIEKID